MSSDLKRYAALIIAKPTKDFSERDKYVIDQYLMHGDGYYGAWTKWM